MNLATFCEIDPLQPREKQVKRTPIPAVESYSLSEFHKDLDVATKKSKREVINILCRMLSQHGDFAEFGTNYPEAFKRLRDMRET